MKRNTIIVSIALIMLLILYLLRCNACNPDGKGITQESEGISTDSMSPDSGGYMPPPPPPPPDPGIIDEQEKASAFYEIPCCADKAKRKIDDCCCLKILEEYAKMVAKKDKRLYKTTTSDPIFSECKNKKKWKLKIDAIDHPPKKDGSPPPPEIGY